MFTSPRAAWMLRYFGAKNVKILNGGLKKWVAEGRDFINDPQDPKHLNVDENGNYNFVI